MTQIKFIKLTGVTSTLNDDGETKVRVVFEDTVPLETAHSMLTTLSSLKGTVVDLTLDPIQKELFTKV